MEPLLSVKQVAFILKVHPLTIRRYIKQKRLVAVKIGGNVRIKESDLQNFHSDLEVATPRERIIISAKKPKEYAFSNLDPMLRLEGKGASLS